MGNCHCRNRLLQNFKIIRKIAMKCMLHNVLYFICNEYKHVPRNLRCEPRLLYCESNIYHVFERNVCCYEFLTHCENFQSFIKEKKMKIRDLIIDNNLKIVRSHRTIITYKEAELFYEEHKEKFFYNRLLTFMCSGPSDIHILADHNAIAKWRQLMGPTKVYQAQYIAPDTIRGMYGLSDTRNATHGSDSVASAEREINIFFSDFNIKKWYEHDEKYYNLGQIHFDPIAFLHTINTSFVNTNKEQITK